MTNLHALANLRDLARCPFIGSNVEIRRGEEIIRGRALGSLGEMFQLPN